MGKAVKSNVKKTLKNPTDIIQTDILEYLKHLKQLIPNMSGMMCKYWHAKFHTLQFCSEEAER